MSFEIDNKSQEKLSHTTMSYLFLAVLVIIGTIAFIYNYFSSYIHSYTYNDEPITITIWESEDSIANINMLRNWAKEFETLQNNVVVKVFHYNHDVFNERFLEVIKTSYAPDLLFSASDNVGYLQKLNLILPAENYFSVEKFVPFALKSVRLFDKVWGYPVILGNHLLLYYNKKFISKPPVTTHELLQMIRSLPHSKKKNSFHLGFPLTIPYWFVPFLGAFDAWPLKGENDVRVEFDISRITQALDYVKMLINEENLLDLRCRLDCQRMRFSAGDIAFMVDIDSMFSQYIQSLGSDVSVAPLPILSETKLPLTPLVGGKYFYVTYQELGKKQKVIESFFEFMSSKNIQQTIAESLDQLPASKESHRSNFVLNNPMLELIKQGYRYARPTSNTIVMRAFWNALDEVLPQVFGNSISSEVGAKAIRDLTKRRIEILNSSSR